MNINNIAILLITVLLLSLTAVAQVNTPTSQNSFDKPEKDGRGGMIARELGLTEEQQVQIRKINRRQRQHLRVAQMRLRTARAAADLAIYDDVFDEALVGERIKEVAMAQAEITKIRMMSEVAVRNVLSPEQLVKFRDLRERVAAQRKRRAERRRNMQLQRRRNDRPPRNPENRPPPDFRP